MFLNLLNIIKDMLFFTGSYSNNVFPEPLSSEEEEICINKMLNGDKEARNKLIEHNLRLVAHIVKKYDTKEAMTDDLISIGTIGLIKGIDTYNGDRKTKITTYAARCIQNEILMHFRAQKKSAGDVSLSDTIDMDGEGNGLSVMDVVCYEDDIDEKISSEELCKSLRESIDRVLTPREAEIIRLRYGLNGAEAKTQQEAAVRC